MTAVIAITGDAILLLTMIVFTYQAQQMAKQSRQVATATRASVYQAITEQMLDIDRMFVNNPELRPFIYGNMELPTEEPLRTRVLAVAELFVDFFDNFVIQSGQIPRELYLPWRRYAESIMRSSPAACAFWNANREWYSELLQELLDPVSSPQDDLEIQMQSAQDWAEVGE